MLLFATLVSILRSTYLPKVVSNFRQVDLAYNIWRKDGRGIQLGASRIFGDFKTASVSNRRGQVSTPDL